MILGGVRRTIGICWDDSERGRLPCRDWDGRRHYFLRLYDSSSPATLLALFGGAACGLSFMHEDSVLNRAKGVGGMGTVQDSQYTAKDFQLEVLDRLEEMQEFCGGSDRAWERKLEAVKGAAAAEIR